MFNSKQNDGKCGEMVIKISVGFVSTHSDHN